MELIKYPDGSSYMKSEIGEGASHTFVINSYEDLWHLNQFVDSCNYTPVITIPWLIDSQADRRFNKNESFGLKLVCQFLNNLDAQFKIFHPHNQEVVEAIMSNVEIIDNSEFIKKVLWGEGGVDYPELILMSSDAGGFKPLMKLCDKINWRGETYSASKSRRYENGETQINQIVDRADFQGKDILIVDDLCIFGGTFKGLSQLLKERNCGNLYLAVSHLTVQHLGSDPITNYYDKVFVTNSKFDYYRHEDNEGQYSEDPENLYIIKQF